MTEGIENTQKVYQPYIRVWIFLLILTGLTLFLSSFHLGKLSIWIALAIASVKSGLVVYFFMHLKDEQPLFKLMFLLALVLLAIFIALTLFDTTFR